MAGPEPRELGDLAVIAATAGARVALDLFRGGQLTIETKADADDLVSAADRQTESAVLAVLAENRPADGVLAEESGTRAGRSGITWAVDPIDGTTSYLYGRPDWAVSVAAVDDEGTVLAGVVLEPVLARLTRAHAGGGTWCGERRLNLAEPVLNRSLIELNMGRPDQKASIGRLLDLLLPRVRDIRRGGSAAAALANVAHGAADGAWLPGLQPWDCAAGVLLVTEAGGVVGDRTGDSGGRVPGSGDVLAGPPG